MYSQSRWVAIIAILSIGLTAVACGASATATGASNGAPAVQVASAARGTAAGLSYSGNVVAKQQVSIVPKVAGRVTKLNVDVGSEVKAGDALLELDKDAATAQVAQAEAGLAAAQAKLDGMLAGPRAEQIAQLQANVDAATQKLAAIQKGPRAEVVAQAQANLQTAQSKLQQLKDGPSAEQRRAAEQNVEGAKVALNSANVTKDGNCNPAPYHPEYQCQAAKAAAVAAQHAVDAAQAQYDALVAPPTKEQLAQARAAVDTAQQQLKLAQSPYTAQDTKQAQDAVQVAEQQLKLAQTPFVKQDIDAARAQVAQAKAALDLANVQLAETTVRAPFDGVVAQRLVSEGSLAGPTAPVLTLLSRETEVAINVDETGLATLKVGLPAVVTASAYPSVEFEASIIAVAPSVDPKTRTALVRLAIDDPDWRLRDGMIAGARLGADSTAGALLVPASAIAQEGGDNVVYVASGGKVSRRVVTTGPADGDQVAITAGLSEGERVVVSGTDGLKDGQIVVVR